jgi:DNA-binding response OmpR family regulator
LLARLRALLRRPGTLAGSMLIHGNIKLDLCSKHLEIQVAIHRLRKKLVCAGATFELKTLRGIGYILQVEKVTA